MKEGLLWFDNDPQRQLADKVSRAAARYQVKFGRKPTLCYLNARELGNGPTVVDGVELRPATDVQRHHFWVGVDHEAVAAKAA